MYLSTLYPFLSAICVFILGLLVFIRNPKNRLNWTFALHALVIFGWLMGTFMMFLSRGNNEASIFWDRFIYGVVVFIPAFMYQFCLALTKRKNNIFLYLAYLLSVFFLLISRTDYFVSGIFEYKWGVHTKAQFFHHLFLLYFSSYAIAWFFIVYNYYKKETSTLARYQTKYFFIAFLILFTIGPTAYLPAYGISIYPFSYLSGLFFAIIISYAILKYRLMDMRIIARYLVIYSADSLFVYFVYLLLIPVSPKMFDGVYNGLAVFAGLIFAPIFVILFINFDRFARYLVDRFFFYSLYDYRQTITKLARELNNYNDLDKIISLIVESIKLTMGLNRAGILLLEKIDGSSSNKSAAFKISKISGFDVVSGNSLISDDFLIRYLQKTAKPLVREELPLLASDIKSVKEQQALFKLEQDMESIGALVCLPLISGRQLRGLIILGVKNSGDPYTEEDLDLLSTLSLQAVIAIDNARLYQETKNFNKLLQKKVDEQTRELQARAEHLEKLLKMREEFLDIASHQLKTPVSVIRGTISMFRDGSMDKLPEADKKKFFDNIYHKAEKLNVIIADILRASEIESEDFQIDPASSKPAKIEEMISGIYSDLHDLAADKKITFDLALPPKPLPMVYTSADFLEQALYNLTDNAIKYTAEGGVKIAAEMEGDKIKIVISDTGIGIPANDQKKMFDKFSRAKNAVNMYADGSGLGLFIAKQIIEAHPGGQISFKSEEGKGTAFTVYLLPAMKIVKKPAATIAKAKDLPKKKPTQ